MSRASSYTSNSHMERNVIPTDLDDLQEAIEMLPWLSRMAVKVGDEVELNPVVRGSRITENTNPHPAVSGN